MSFKQSLKSFVFSYNIIRSQREQFGSAASSVLLAVNTLQIISILTLIPYQKYDLFSLTLKNTIGLFALPNFINALGIPPYLVLFGLIAIFGVYIAALLVCVFSLKTEDKMQKYFWVLAHLPQGDMLHFYKRFTFVPVLQLALSEIIHSGDAHFNSRCPFSGCEQMNFGLGIALLVMGLFVYSFLTYITLPCNFHDEAQEESLGSAVEMIKVIHLTLTIGINIADINVYIGLSFWGAFWVLDLIEFLWIGRYTRPKIEHFATILKGVEISTFCIFVLSDALDASASNYSFVGFIVCPFSIKLVYNLKLIAERHVVTQFSSNLHGIQSLQPRRVHKYLKSLLYKRNAHSTKSHEHSAIDMSALTLSKENAEATEGPATVEDEERFYKDYFKHEESLGQNLIDATEKIYSVISYDEKNQIKPDITFKWILFLKDVKKSHVKAYTLLSQMQKSMQHSSLRIRLQKELLEYLIRQEITANAVEKSVSAEAIFKFLDDVQKTKQTVERYLVKSFEFFILLQNQIVKASDIKKHGGKLLAERESINKQLNSLLAKNSVHPETIQLVSFFVKEIMEENYEVKFWEIEKKRNLYASQKRDKTWHMSMEFLTNSIDDPVSPFHVLVVSLDPVHVGQVLKISKRLAQLLDVAGSPTMMLIDSLEMTFFNRRNMKWIKDQIAEGKNPFDVFIQKERVIYLKNNNGRFLAFHFLPCLEIYDGVPTIVCYLRSVTEHNNKFIIFNPYKQNRIVGIGEGLLWLEAQSLKGRRVQDLIPSFPNDCQELTKTPVIEGASFNWRALKKISVTTDKSLPSLDAKRPSTYQGSHVVDYFVEMLHTAALTRRYGVVTITQSLKKESQKARIKLTDGDSTPLLPMQRAAKKSLFTNCDDDRSQDVKFEVLTNDQLKFETQIGGDDPKLLQLQIEPSEGREGAEGKETRKSIFSESKLVKMEYVSETHSDSGIQEFNPIFELKHEKPKSSFKLKGHARFSGSTTSSYLTRTSYLRSLINGNNTPTVIKIIYVFGAIIFGMTIICTIAVYGVLTTQYERLSDFASHATFPGFLKLVSVSLYEAAEMQLGINYNMYGNMYGTQTYWPLSVETIVSKRFTTFVQTYGDNLVNFNPETLTDKLHMDNYTMDLTGLPELHMDAAAADFYDATAVFMSYAQTMNLLPKMPQLFSPTLLEFMRFFSAPYGTQMLDPIREVLVQSAYGQYDYVLTLLNTILIICVFLITTLVFSFGIVFRKFENMETIALSKLCTVLPKEHLTQEINKFITIYESKLGKCPSLSGYTKYNPNLVSEKAKKGQRITQSTRKIVQDQVSMQKLTVILLLAAVGLSGSFLLTNIVFRSKTQILLPYLKDLDLISNGISSYTIIFAILLRFTNEIKNPNINETLPGLVETYQPIITQTLQSHEEMIPIFRDFTSRIIDTDITSWETKARYQNNTNDNFCASRDQNGTQEIYINLCKTSVKNVASRGLPDTADLVINTVAELIQQFVDDPTPATANSILNSSDIWYFNYLTTIVTNVIQYLAASEQIDISLYANSLVTQTSVLRLLCLAYTCLMIVFVWIPTIVYLKRRFRRSRNIFLLFPMRLLNSNEHIKRLFKKW